MNSLIKSIKIHTLGFLGALFLRILNRSIRWRRIGLDKEQLNWACGEPRIIAFWHNRQLLMPWVYLNAGPKHSRRPIAVLTSQHTDGRIIASVLHNLGTNNVAGSSSRGGREALFALIDTLKSGSHIAITPDGPKGPIYKLKPGTIRIAQRSGAPIYPTAIRAEKQWVLGSWDKMIIPKPFSRAVLIMGEAVHIPAEIEEGEMEGLINKVESALNQVTQQADSFDFGG